jgi:hypothetical protein
MGAARIHDEMQVAGFIFDTDRDAVTAAIDGALARWVAQGLPAGRATDGGPGFNPAEVQNFMVWSALHLGDPFWRNHYVGTSRRVIASLAPRPVATVRLRRRFALGGRMAGRRLRLPLPLGMVPGTLRLLGDWPTVPTPWPGRLDCLLPDGQWPALDLGWEASFATTPQMAAGTLDAADRQLWTRASEGLVQASPDVAALARHAVSGAREPMDRAMRLWRAVNRLTVVGKPIGHEIDLQAPMDWLLRRHWADCRLGSALLVSLARSIDMPARLVGGYTLYPKTPFPHFWAELWLEELGWRPFDLFSWVLAAGGTAPEWRDHFAGTVDARLTVEIHPRIVLGPLGVALPRAWYFAALADPTRGVVEDLETGAPVYWDEVSVLA